MFNQSAANETAERFPVGSVVDVNCRAFGRFIGRVIEHYGMNGYGVRVEREDGSQRLVLASTLAQIEPLYPHICRMTVE